MCRAQGVMNPTAPSPAPSSELITRAASALQAAINSRRCFLQERRSGDEHNPYLLGCLQPCSALGPHGRALAAPLPFASSCSCAPRLPLAFRAVLLLLFSRARQSPTDPPPKQQKGRRTRYLLQVKSLGFGLGGLPELSRNFLISGICQTLGSASMGCLRAHTAVLCFSPFGSPSGPSELSKLGRARPHGARTRAGRIPSPKPQPVPGWMFPLVPASFLGAWKGLWVAGLRQEWCRKPLSISDCGQSIVLVPQTQHRHTVGRAIFLWL